MFTYSAVRYSVPMDIEIVLASPALLSEYASSRHDTVQKNGGRWKLAVVTAIIPR